jgi:hypothetical protein
MYNQKLSITEGQTAQWSHDTKWVIRSCQSQKDTQHNGQKTKDKMTNLINVSLENNWETELFWKYFYFCKILTAFNQWMRVGYRVTVFNGTFNNISAILWWSDLLVEDTGVPWENHWPAAIQTVSYNAVSSTPHLSGIRTHNVSGDISTGCIGS